MTYREIRGMYMRNERRLFASFGAQGAGRDQTFFHDVWKNMSYYERLKTVQRLSRPGLHCLCLPTCPKL